MSPKTDNTAPVSFDVLSGLGQELHAPLQSLVKSSSKLIADYKSRNFEYISYKDFRKIMTTIELMNRQLARCADTTNGMMELHRLKNRTASDTSKLNDVVGYVLGILRQQIAEANVKVVVKYARGLPVASIGNVECHQVAYNILLNAIQAMRAGGTIKIRTVFNKPRKMVALHVEDEGVGISPEHLNKVFEPFFTTKERGFEKNTGLGLSVVQAIVTAAKGEIDIDSSLRRGTTVRIELPITKKSVA